MWQQARIDGRHNRRYPIYFDHKGVEISTPKNVNELFIVITKHKVATNDFEKFINTYNMREEKKKSVQYNALEFCYMITRMRKQRAGENSEP